jgi:hypothetical protein
MLQGPLRPPARRYSRDVHTHPAVTPVAPYPRGEGGYGFSGSGSPFVRTSRGCAGGAQLGRPWAKPRDDAFPITAGDYPARGRNRQGQTAERQRRQKVAPVVRPGAESRLPELGAPAGATEAAIHGSVAPPGLLGAAACPVPRPPAFDSSRRAGTRSGRTRGATFLRPLRGLLFAPASVLRQGQGPTFGQLRTDLRYPPPPRPGIESPLPRLDCSLRPDRTPPSPPFPPEGPEGL